MQDYIIGGIIVAILAIAIWYIVRAKKNGAKCIGCSSSKDCSKKDCNCNNTEDTVDTSKTYDELINFDIDEK